MADFRSEIDSDLSPSNRVEDAQLVYASPRYTNIPKILSAISVISGIVGLPASIVIFGIINHRVDSTWWHNLNPLPVIVAIILPFLICFGCGIGAFASLGNHPSRKRYKRLIVIGWLCAGFWLGGMIMIDLIPSMR